MLRFIAVFVGILGLAGCSSAPVQEMSDARQAINAARAIKFAPAIKDGQVAGQYMQLEYTFNLY